MRNPLPAGGCQGKGTAIGNKAELFGLLLTLQTPMIQLNKGCALVERQ
jgi:hypothetical protein